MGLAKIFMAMNHWSFYSKKIVQQCISRQNPNRHCQVATKNREEIGGDFNEGCISLPFKGENEENRRIRDDNYRNCYRLKKKQVRYFTTTSKADAKGEYKFHVQNFRKSGNQKHYDETVEF